MEVVTDAERRFAKKVADRAMMIGWYPAIRRFSIEEGLKEQQIVLILNAAEKYNDMADPSGRIPELADWKLEKRQVSKRAGVRGFGKSPR